ncbi:MAG: DivIVA domain-containing protein [Candidatus Tectimicrobiota bacterium]
MKLTPLEIRQQRFHVKFRGFDPQEVDTFLEMVADEFEDLLQASEAARHEVRRLQKEVQSLRQETQRLREVLKAAEGAKSQTIEALRGEAAEARAQAAREAQAIVEAGRREQAKAQQAVEAFVEKRRQMLTQLRNLLESQLRLLEMEEGEVAQPVPPKPRG